MSDSPLVQLSDLTVDFDGRFTCREVNWAIESDQHWLICGANGSGKSAMAAIIAGFGHVESGAMDIVPERVGLVSFEAQAELIEAERRKDDADILDVISEGTPVSEIIAATCVDPELADRLTFEFGLDGLLDRAFRKLSTGESRKVMLIRALTSDPQLLVLDEPFAGLDSRSSAALGRHLVDVAETVPIVIVLNRVDQRPDFITHVGLVVDGRLSEQIEVTDTAALGEVMQLVHLQASDLDVPPPDPDSKLPDLVPGEPLVRLTSAAIRYGETVIFEDLNWTISPGEHWQVSGPNGSGKTALLSLITGDHPQCYVNDLVVFGFQRGSGESIWQIKQFIGYVSTALQWEYTVGISLRNVIISGFYDSIGLYNKYTDRQREIAHEWLAVLGMQDRADQRFGEQSYGDQRLLLIARAMVKHPPLLILDEPCLGLDEVNRQKVLALVEIICGGSETTVLYVSHDTADRIRGMDHNLMLGDSLRSA